MDEFMPKTVKLSTKGYEMQNLRCKFANVQGHFNQSFVTFGKPSLSIVRFYTVTFYTHYEATQNCYTDYQPRFTSG